MTVTWLIDVTIDSAGSQGAQWLQSIVPVNQIYTLVALLLYSSVSFSTILWLLPLLAFYSFFAVLLIVTAQMLYSGRRAGDSRTVSGLLQKFSLSFDANSAASAYCWDSMKPYATFFGILPLCVAALTVADDAWIPSPELMALSGLACVTCFFALSDRYDFLAFGAILIDIVCMILPAVVKHLHHFPILYNILWYSIGPGYALEFPFAGLQLAIGLPSLAFLIVPVKFVRMIVDRSWHGTYQILVPHLVCFLWWRLAVMFFSRSTWFGITRAVVGWVGLLIMLPVLGFVAIGYVVYLIFRAVSLSNILKIVTTAILLFGASAFAMWSSSGFQFGSYFSLESKSPLSRAVLIIALVLGSCVPFALVFGPSLSEVHQDRANLPWSTYYQYCTGPEADLAVCAHFAGAPIAGSSTVLKISVIEIDNLADALTSWLPNPAANWLHCAYGSQYPDDCDSSAASDAYRSVCHYNKRRGRRCHLRDFDRYTYEVILSLPNANTDGETVRLIAADWFREPASFIHPGHEVSIRARLPDTVFTDHTLTLHSIRCISCDDGEASARHQSRWHLLASIRTAVLSVCNFFLQPLFSFV